MKRLDNPRISKRQIAIQTAKPVYKFHSWLVTKPNISIFSQLWAYHFKWNTTGFLLMWTVFLLYVLLCVKFRHRPERKAVKKKISGDRSMQYAMLKVTKQQGKRHHFYCLSYEFCYVHKNAALTVELKTFFFHKILKHIAYLNYSAWL